jgi:hypothetical protein
LEKASTSEMASLSVMESTSEMASLSAMESTSETVLTLEKASM